MMAVTRICMGQNAKKTLNPGLPLRVRVFRF